jgi:hypothetical protein
MIEFDRAMTLKNPATLFDVIDKYRIDATLLPPATPAVSLLDHLQGWQRVYADDVAVVHIRESGAPAQTTIKPLEGMRP